MCVYIVSPPPRASLSLGAVAQTKSSDKQAKLTNQTTEKASAI